MKKQNFKKRLTKALHQSPFRPDENHFGKTLLLARNQACQKQSRVRISFTHFLFLQIKFTGWKIWSIQGGILLAVLYAFSHFFHNAVHPQYMAKLLFCFSVLLLMTAIPFLYRSARYHMQEIEAASRFSSVKLLIARLLVIGFGNIFMLSGIFLAAIFKTSLGIGSTVLYLGFPFLFVCGVCLFMLGHFTPKHFLAGSMGICTLLLFSAIPKQHALLFRQSFSPGWLLLCALLLAFCIQQFHYIIYYSHYTEMQIS
ncbi:hypothetical protein [Parablautia muri]|uniref:Uncharacterized protein n=1 Tax=Parablautia muri TaxID=2320879 RepID=A0A9X5GT93_9FIRM|nr:hypothetical protein [Parablautia muri]NBJ93761.1 hypothetical protein [Parablautia muri]